jgi:hypothetical protein
MEVHAHAHTDVDPDRHRGRKKFTHYLWEFLMLFLAVFCGFLAENQREKYVEAHRAHDYAKQLYEDLKKDTTDIASNVSDNNNILSYIDSLQKMVKTIGDKREVPGSFYYYSRLVTTSTSVDWSRSTMNQIINSGNARYFQEKDLLFKISEYDEIATLINSMYSNDRLFRTKTMELRSRILSSEYFDKVASIVMEEGEAKLKEIKDSTYPLQNNDPALLNEFLNSCLNRKATLHYLINIYLPRSLVTAKELIGILKKEYHLE